MINLQSTAKAIARDLHDKLKSGKLEKIGRDEVINAIKARNLKLRDYDEIETLTFRAVCNMVK